MFDSDGKSLTPSLESRSACCAKVACGLEFEVQSLCTQETALFTAKVQLKLLLKLLYGHSCFWNLIF